LGTFCILENWQLRRGGYNQRLDHIKVPLIDLFQPFIGKIYSWRTLSFLVISVVLTFLWSVTLLMTSSGHAYGHVTHSEKMWRLPSMLLYHDIFPWFNVFNVYAMHRFFFISKRSDLERISKYWKICNFLKRTWFCQRNASYVSNVGFNRNSSKKPDLMKDHISFSNLETISVCDIYWKLPYQCVHSSHYQQLNKIKRSARKPHRHAFSLSSSFAFVFVLLLVCCCLYFSTLNFVKH